MKFSPCKNDVQVIVFFEIPMLVIFLIAWCFFLEFQRFAIWVCLIACVIAFSEIIPLLIYFSRTITITDRSCIIETGPFKREYPLEAMVAWRVRKNRGCALAELGGPGIILAVKPFRKSRWFSSMSYCSHFHPFKSVFLDFGPHVDQKKSAKLLYDGYHAAEEDLIPFIEERNIEFLLCP